MTELSHNKLSHLILKGMFTTPTKYQHEQQQK